MPLRPGMCVHTGTHAYRWSHATGSTRAGHPAAGAAHYGVVSVATAAAPAYCRSRRKAGGRGECEVGLAVERSREQL